MNNNKLAIVIPAFKPDFLNEAVRSLADQTCQKFTLYIGNDASPFDLDPIILPYLDKIDLVYKKFDVNLGGHDLVAQWDRCIALTQGEEWIWLFSDDDVMSENCVELFYKSLEKNKNSSLFHFDIQIIDGNGTTTNNCKPFYNEMYAKDIFAEKVKLKITSTVVEYIFKRELYEKENGFVKFDLAWGSDDATWIKFLKKDPVITIASAVVFWRYSEQNISSSLTDEKIVKRKVFANIEYLRWIKVFFEVNQIADNTSETEKLKWILQTIKGSSLTLNNKLWNNRMICKEAGFSFPTEMWGVLYLLYSNLKSIIN